jgi:hypothetical protein
MSNSKGTAATKRSAAGQDSTGIYESSTDALKEIDDAFDYWSGQITATSVQMCYALIGANWVVFGSVEIYPSQPVRNRVSPFSTTGADFQYGVRTRPRRVHEKQIRLRCF